jgi:hypothetical protein
MSRAVLIQNFHQINHAGLLWKIMHFTWCHQWAFKLAEPRYLHSALSPNIRIKSLSQHYLHWVFNDPLWVNISALSHPISTKSTNPHWVTTSTLSHHIRMHWVNTTAIESPHSHRVTGTTSLSNFFPIEPPLSLLSHHILMDGATTS